MTGIDRLTSILQIVLVIIVTVIILIGLGIFWYVKVKKPKKKINDEVDYSNLNRKDSKDLIKFDDIVDDMIITNNGWTYHAAIQCKGFDFFSASPQEQVSARNGYLSFINIIKDKLYYRQYTKKENLDDTIKMYSEAYDRIEVDLYNATMDFSAIQEMYVSEREECLKAGREMDVEKELTFLDELERLDDIISKLTWKRDDLKLNIDYVRNMGEQTAPERVEAYFFKWTYAPVVGKELTDEQIYDKAKKELNRMAAAYIAALSNAGVRSVRVKTNQLRQMYRRHWHPYTADIYRDIEIENSSFNVEIVDSPAMIDAEYELAASTGMLDVVERAQSKLVSQGKDAESMTLDELIEFDKGIVKEKETKLTTQDISDFKNVAKDRKEKKEDRAKKVNIGDIDKDISVGTLGSADKKTEKVEAGEHILSSMDFSNIFE